MFTFAAPIGRKGKFLERLKDRFLGEDLKESELKKKEKKLFGNVKNLLTFAIPKRGMLERAKRRAGRTGE